MTRSDSPRLALTGAALTLCLVTVAAGWPAGQTASAPSLKAALLYNFAKFTEWPADVLPERAALVLCVAGDDRVVSALEEATAARDIDGHPLVVRPVHVEGALRACHLLHVEGLDEPRSIRLIAALDRAPILVVSDLRSFSHMGGMVSLFVEEGRMRFGVNLETIRRNRLRVSSRLLSLAKFVKDHSNVSER